MLPLSLRLQTIVDRLEPCELLADIGTDHGSVVAGAVLRGIATRALAVDLRALPLIGAKRLLEQQKLLDRVTLVQSDGFDALSDEAIDAVVMAGMTGQLMVRMLTRAPISVARLQQLVVQPNRGACALREFAQSAGFHLVHEDMVIEKQRHFVVCTFARRAGADPAYADLPVSQEYALRLGPLLLKRRDPVAHSFYTMERDRFLELSQKAGEQHLPDLQLYEAALSLYLL